MARRTREVHGTALQVKDFFAQGKHLFFFGVLDGYVDLHAFGLRDNVGNNRFDIFTNALAKRSSEIGSFLKALTPAKKSSPGFFDFDQG